MSVGPEVAGGGGLQEGGQVRKEELLGQLGERFGLGLVYLRCRLPILLGLDLLDTVLQLFI